MSEPEQCIICLDPLPHPSSLDKDHGGAGAGAAPTVSHVNGDTVGDAVPVPAATAPQTNGDNNEDVNYLDIVAALDGCNHIIHDVCIRSWAQKTNTCPICRNPFHSVRVYNGVDGTVISEYEVQDKKQVAEFDFQQWLGENPEEEEEQNNPCPICNSSEREDILLLCDSCDAAYHTHCVGLDIVPDGDWYCMECAHLFQLTTDPEPIEVDEQPTRPQVVRRPVPRSVRGHHVRTRARLRRARRQARNAEWQGAWGQFSGRFYEMSELDLDNHDEEDEELEQYRRFQELGRRELERWQQRVDIAHRLGARDAFANNIPPAISERLQPPPPPPVEETRDERRAWGALDRVREAEDTTSPPNARKRKARSVTASPREPAQEPERKLKRPRTRRLPTHNGEGPSSVPSPVVAGPSALRATNGSSSNGALSRGNSDPPLVSSLLKELEPYTTSEDETSLNIIGWRPPPDASSPAISPIASPSAYSSPRALSLTPPPLPSVGGRPTSPTLSLSTHIQPRYPPANYSPTRSSPTRRSPPRKSPTRKSPTGNSPTRNSPPRLTNEHSDSESRPPRLEGRPLELRQPRPRRLVQVPAQAEEQNQPPQQQLPQLQTQLSPTRWTMTQEEKKNINDIVKSALRPHWRAQKLTTEQYATINRDISRKLYDEVKNASSLNDEARRSWEKRANKEVAQAVSELQA
ncbi:hypothetical protein BGZ63DRAFT_400157 [Mariannaea sp. PMI_226]|nr:hypothetical protein BGZ63DRAFT_400157 [Mariannaea sp. PMI_226]